MKKFFTRAPLVAAGLLLMAGPVHAAPIEVKVPFSFTVGDRALPAGQYLVERLGNSSSVMLIEGERGTSASAIVLTNPAEGQDPRGDVPALTFKRGEKMNALSAIWESGNHGYSVAR